MPVIVHAQPRDGLLGDSATPPLVGLAVCLVLFPGFAWSEQGRVIVVAKPAVADADFHETFDDAVPVAGSPLVGLAMAPRQGRLDPANVLVLDPSEDAKTVCVQTTTQDGRFAASNPYQVDRSEPNSVIRLEPITQSHRNALAAYDRAQFAVRAYMPLGDECSPFQALHLPEMPNNNEPTSSLVVMANGKSRTGVAKLRAPTGDALAEARCATPSTGARIAFDLICDLDVANLAGGRVTLVIEFNDGFATEPYEYAVFLPLRDGGG